MYASFVEAKMKAGTSAHAIRLAKKFISYVGNFPNIKQIFLIDKGNGNVLPICLFPLI